MYNKIRKDPLTSAVGFVLVVGFDCLSVVVCLSLELYSAISLVKSSTGLSDEEKTSHWVEVWCCRIEDGSAVLGWLAGWSDPTVGQENELSCRLTPSSGKV